MALCLALVAAKRRLVGERLDFPGRATFWPKCPSRKPRRAPLMDAADVLAQAQDAVEYAEERCAAAPAPALHAERL